MDAANVRPGCSRAIGLPATLNEKPGPRRCAMLIGVHERGDDFLMNQGQSKRLRGRRRFASLGLKLQLLL